MYCTQCGFQLEDTDLYCAKCGKAAREGVPPRPEAPAKKLVRPMKEKRIAGVCAGFANYFEMDVTLMRILWLTFALIWGVGFIAYLVAWIAMPKDYGPAANAAPGY